MNTFKQQQRQNADQAMTEIELIVCPYDSGKRDWRCGAGPRRILDDALRPALDTASIGFHLSEIEPQSAYPCEASLGFDAQRRIANTAIDARKEGRLPAHAAAFLCHGHVGTGGEFESAANVPGP